MWKRVPIVSNIKRIIPWFCICTLVCKELSFCRPATTTVFLPNDTSLVGHSRQLFLEKKIWQPTIHYSVTHSRQTQVETTGAAFSKPPVRAPSFEANLTWWPNRAISPKRLFTISLHYGRHGYKMENNLFSISIFIHMPHKMAHIRTGQPWFPILFFLRVVIRVFVNNATFCILFPDYKFHFQLFACLRVNLRDNSRDQIWPHYFGFSRTPNFQRLIYLLPNDFKEK